MLSPAERRFFRRAYFKGSEKVNLAGWWREGCKGPLWVLTSLVPEAGLEIYQKRMKIEIRQPHYAHITQMSTLPSARSALAS